MSKGTVLVVDDDQHVVELVKLYLEKEGYRVTAASSGVTAMAQMKSNPPDLVVLDVMLPDVDGWEVCRQVRRSNDVPIIMLSARDQDIDKIVGLEIGADDYLTKPFEPRELMARVKAVLRRYTHQDAGEGERAIVAGKLRVEPQKREVAVNGELVRLRPKEFDVLLELAQNPGRVLSREQLLNRVWGYDFYGGSRTVDVHIRHLREKLQAVSPDAAALIETVWSVGYRFKEPVHG